jgi:hypothetical protein
MADTFSVKVKRTGRFKPANLDNAGLTRIGNTMVEAQLKRWALGINAEGNAAKPLGKKHFFEKRGYFRKMGITRPVIRDNNVTGALVKNFTLRKAISGVIRAEPTQRATRAHANRAQLYEEMIGFSGPEQVLLFKTAQAEYGDIFTKAWVPIVNG